jgi:hypothetical protein
MLLVRFLFLRREVRKASTARGQMAIASATRTNPKSEATLVISMACIFSSYGLTLRVGWRHPRRGISLPDFSQHRGLVVPKRSAFHHAQRFLWKSWRQPITVYRPVNLEIM